MPGIQLGSGLNSLGRGKISTAPYVSDTYFEREKAIWKNSWLVAGLLSDLKVAGDYITFDFPLVHASVIVTRGKDTKLRAFHNVCSHRSGRIICDKAAHGHTKFLTCPFHGWVFDLDGKLRSISKESIFEGLPPKSELGLHEISVDTWGGFVFINLSDSPEHSLAAYMQGLPATLHAYLQDRPWSWYTGYSETFDANWKDLINIQHEGYHATFLHRNTLAVDFAPQDCANTIFPNSPGVCSLLTVSRPDMPGDPIARLSPIQKLSMKHGRTSNWVENDTSSAATAYPGAVNHLNSNRWVFDCYTIFPNLLLFVGASVLSVMRVWPISAHKTAWEWDWFFDHKATNFGELFNLEHGRLATRNALAEDWGIIGLVHENMRSGVFPEMNVAQDMEATVRALYEKLITQVPLQKQDYLP
jgi:phenylpropionate dioxygenase-like ring-hydroxylating dioxygenase large terminal subunit